MSAIRTSQHIRTHRMARSFRSCPNATGASQILPDLGRVYIEEMRRLFRKQVLELRGDRRKTQARSIT